MPGIDGFDVLAWMQDQEITPARTVVLTTSDDLPEITRAYALGADSFLSKAFRFYRVQRDCRRLARTLKPRRRPPRLARPLGNLPVGQVAWQGVFVSLGLTLSRPFTQPCYNAFSSPACVPIRKNGVIACGPPKERRAGGTGLESISWTGNVTPVPDVAVQAQQRGLGAFDGGHG